MSCRDTRVKTPLLVLVFALSTTAITLPTLAGEAIVVTYSDGKQEKGELIEQNSDRIVIRVTVGSSHVDLPILWTKIRGLSNGITRDSALQKWKDDNRDKLCPECNGGRKIPCKRCYGGGLMARALIACTACKSAGTSQCTAKGCENGKAPCPGNCMKLYEGKWVKGKEDLLWHRFYYKGGWVEWNERHCGDVIELKDNKIVNSGPCPICNRTTRVPCKACEGKGLTNCPLCKGAKEISVPGPEKKCPDCNGAKALVCPTCKGTGLKRD
jgi:hypothetical protein